MSQAYRIQDLDEAHSHLSPNFLDNLTLTEKPIPIPGEGSVLIRIRAVSLNYRDLLIVAHSPLYPTQAKDRLIPCCDGAGEIVSVGPSSKWKDSIGEAVILQPSGSWIDGGVGAENFILENTLGGADIDGTLSQYVVIGDEWVLRAPRNLSFEEAAALPVTGGTTMNALSSIRVQKETTVLTMGTGGVSCTMIQFVSALGGKVIASSSSDEKLAIAKKLGASESINYKSTPAWGDEVLRLTNGRGVDLVADVGGSGTVEESLKSARYGGTVALIGFVAPPKDTDVVLPLFLKAQTLRGILGFSKEMLQQAVDLTEKHNLHPIIKVYEWEDAKKAFEHMKRQDFVGKIVIRV